MEANLNFNKLKKKIVAQKIKVAIIGLGYVGLPLAVEFTKASIKVEGIDVSKKKIEKLKKGISYIQDVSSADIKNALKNKTLNPTINFKGLKEQDVVIICVPTPLRKSRDPDLSYIVDSSKKVAENIQSETVLILESTSYPGTTREILLEELKKKGFKIGDIFVAFSPERVDPGNKFYGIKTTPKVVGGIDKKSSILAEGVYKIIVDEVIKVASCEEAEMVKLLENTFRAVNIGLINEMALLCDKFSLDIWNIIRAAATKPFGFMPFYPGPGLGGHCLPVDPQFLSWKAKSSQFYPRFIDYAEEINNSMPRYVVSKITSILNEKQKSVNSAKILLMGVSYKKNVGDVRESPAFEIAEYLKKLKAKVSYTDPYVNNFMSLKRVAVDKINYANYDCVVVVTEHDKFDFKKMVEKSQLIVDCRGVTLDLKAKTGKIKRV